MLENTLESPLDCKEIKLVNPKGNKSWIFIGRTDAEAETPILWSPDTKSQLIGKDTDAGQDWRQEEKGRAEDEMVGWHHQLNGHEFEQALWTGNPDMLQSMQSQRVRHDWEIELNWTIIPPQGDGLPSRTIRTSPPWVWCYSPQTRMHCFICSFIIHALEHTYDEQWAGLSGVLTNGSCSQESLVRWETHYPICQFVSMLSTPVQRSSKDWIGESGWGLRLTLGC